MSVNTVAEKPSRAAPDVVDLPRVTPFTRKRSVLVWLSFAWLTVIILTATLADVLPIPSYAVPVGLPRQTPQWSVTMLLGSDSLGRSLLARCVYGGRVSLVVGAVAGLSGFAVGTLAGLIAGYLRRYTDAVLMYVTDALLAFPPLILLLALSSVLKPSLTTLLFGLGILVVPAFVRLSRANTLAWSAREFVRAARNMGAGDLRIMTREVLPNVLPTLAAYLPIVVASLIVAEGSLSFLGLGIPPPTPSWGGIIADGKDAIADAPHIVFMPALVLFLTVFSLNQVGDFLRARLDRTATD